MHLILITESDDTISNHILKLLDPKKYTGILRSDFNDIQYQLEQNTVSLVIMGTSRSAVTDFMIYQKCFVYQIPILFMVSGQDDAVTAYDYGINDYIVTPFRIQDLLAKIQFLVHHRSCPAHSLTYGGIQIHFKNHCIVRNGSEVFLTPKEFSLFALLLHNKGSALSRDRILEAIWGYDYTGETRTVDVHIQRLRRKLHLYGRLTTIPKLGYRLEDSAL